jgi:uncharacterized membrane protein YpjA
MKTLIHRIYATRGVESSLVVINLLGFLAGAFYWYGPQLKTTPLYLWPWLVDSPLSVLGFALALPLLRRQASPVIHWLATWAVFSNVKYGLWTVVFWFLWWRGPGTFTPESVTMTFTHAAMVGMGFSLLAFFHPRPWQVMTVAGWFALNDYLDYWQGLAPRVPAGVSLEVLRVEQVVVTTALTILLLGLAQRHDAQKKSATSP